MNDQKLILSTNIPHQHSVCLYETNGKFSVVYGGQSDMFDVFFEALTDYYTCVNHALECNGHEVYRG